MGGQEDIYDPAFVADLFDRCGPNYRIWSLVASLGFVWIWRRQCVQRLKAMSAISQYKQTGLNVHTPEIMDLMAGTGEIWPHVLAQFPKSRITAIDISPRMHDEAKARLHEGYAHRITHLQADALTTEITPASTDFIVCSFGLKTLTPKGQSLLAERIATTLRPGGAFALIEAADPKGWRLRSLYRLYIDRILPLIERSFLRGAQDFAMIGTYTRNFGDCGHFAEALREQGLFASQRAHFFGCASSVAGFKPIAEDGTSA